MYEIYFEAKEAWEVIDETIEAAILEAFKNEYSSATDSIEEILQEMKEKDMIWIKENGTFSVGERESGKIIGEVGILGIGTWKKL